MPENRTQEHTLRRALLGDLGQQWLERNHRAEERIGIAEGVGDLDGRSFGSRDVEATDLFRFLRFMDKEIAAEPYFQLLELNHLDRDAVRTIQGKVPDLGMAALMASGPSSERRQRVHESTWSRVDDYFDVYELAGPKRSGMVEIVLGLMGSGKTTYLVWRAIEGLKRGFETFADFRLTPAVEGFHENYLASTLLLDLVRFARGDPKLPGQVLFGEAGGRGGNSKTASTLEARWRMLFLSRIRMFRVNASSAYQAKKLPDDQMGLTTLEIRKDVADPSLVEGTWLQGPLAGSNFVPFTIPNYDDRYDTYAKASLRWDVNMEGLDAYLSKQHGLKPELDLVEEYVEAFLRGEDPLDEDAEPSGPAYLPPELAAMPDGGWPVACTHAGCNEEWFYKGKRLPVRGARITCPLSHHADLAVALTTRAARDAARGVSAPATTGEAGGLPGD